MGCFSFICKNSGKSINSDSFNGDAVKLYLLKDGKVIEEMHGNYDSYGRVFDGGDGNFEWNLDWGLVCDLMFEGGDGNGIAVVLDKFDDGTVPTTQSEGDPDQGWNRMKYNTAVAEPYHKVY